MFHGSRIPGLAALLLLALPPAWTAQEGADAVTALAEKLKGGGDRADTKIVSDLADLRSRAAVDALLEIYPTMRTVWMRREILRVLHRFDGVPDAELPALQRLMDVATQDPEPELRAAALEGMGQCKGKGRDFLQLIVKSPADDEVRERAMELHVALATAEDHAWYRELYLAGVPEKAEAEKSKQERAKEREQEKKERREKKEAKKKGEEAPPPPKRIRTLDGIRRRAFDVILPTLTADELVDAVQDRCAEIRRNALQDLDRREDKRTLELATAILARPTPNDLDHFDSKLQERADNRVAAARILARLKGPKVAKDFIDRGKAVETPEELRRGLAEILSKLDDPEVTRELVGKIGRGNVREKLFILHAVSGIQDAKVDRAVEKLVFDRDAEIVLQACRVLAERKDKDAVPQLQKLLGKTGKEKPLARAALDAIAVLRQDDPKWVDELLGMTRDEDPDVRNMALQALGRTTDKKFLPKLLEALADKSWSTRLAALDAIEAMRVKEAIPAFIARMPKEDGRMLEELSQALFRLTGQSFEENAAAWENWWKQNGDGFELVTAEKLQKIKAGADEWRLKQETRVDSKFFGIRIVSKKVLLVLDVSLSMNAALLGEFEGRNGETRFDVAKAEMAKAIIGLEPGCYFNIITFSGDVDHWLEGGLQAASEKNREDAKAFVEKATMGYGTNTYGALEEAFKDPDVDTIFFLSDGEPTVGAELDPILIREHVKLWNEHRGILIHTIGIGGQHDILKWLAEDSGGSYKSYD